MDPKKHSHWTGIKKSVKSTVLQWAIPAIIFLLSNYQEWMPPEYLAVYGPIIGVCTYKLTNYLKHR